MNLQFTRSGTIAPLSVRGPSTGVARLPRGASTQVVQVAAPDRLSEVIADRVEYVAGGDRKEITPSAAYIGAASALRESLLKSFNDTHEYWRQEDPKFVYYLSAEFLMGRSFLNVVYNLALGDEYTQALTKLGYALEEVATKERDASLGNGGLGRLAACFLDSMATLNLPGWGYGIRYRYGMFKQALKDGYQLELPDVWLQAGNPYEQVRPHINFNVGFYGSVSDGVWTPGEQVNAIAYDNPIPGYGTKNTANLRLWDSQPVEEFNLEAFNEGDYIAASEARRRAEDICAVLYPNDSTMEGKELRLKQQYFFVSASMQDAVARFKSQHDDMSQLPDKACFQLNDTHPTIGVAELMRLLIDNEGLEWDAAWDITQRSLAFTNHTVMPEALEQWPVDVLGKLLPRHMGIINKINDQWMERLNEHYDIAGLSKAADNAVDVARETASLKAQIAEAEAEAEAEDAGAAEKVQKEKKAVDTAPPLEETPEEAELAATIEKIHRMAIVRPNQWNPSEMLVNMAYLALVGSKAVNGVAAIHSDIIREDLFKDFAEIIPERFQNKTNGVTPRRWLAFCNPGLASLITETLGTDKWKTELDLLQGLKEHAEDPDFQAKWREVKMTNKKALAAVLKEQTGEDVNLDAMFDIHIKRIHEYKRQYMNMLSVIHRYMELKEMSPEERAKTTPRVVVVAGKAASAYDMAKRIVRLVTAVSAVVNKDPDTADLLKVYFLPDYNVSAAEVLIPAAELSQHISTAGTEASGTSNMKFQMNGSLIIGTMDGANVEIAEESGKENMFVFGVDAQDIDRLRKERKDFEPDPRMMKVLDEIKGGTFGDVEYFTPLVDSISDMSKGNDWFLVANDFATYLDAQAEVDELWKDQAEWTRRSIVYTATSGFFSSDRTIAQYAEEIWDVKPMPVP